MSQQPVSSNGIPQNVVWDQEWPVFTVDGTPGTRTAPTGDQTPNVSAVLRDVLGWRPVPTDTKAFTAALAAAFQLTDVEGHVVGTYVPRGFSLQADLGGVSGGQASLYARAKSSLGHMLEILDGLTPLKPAFDQEDGEAVRALVRNEIIRIVDEMGASGGPRQMLVDASFVILAGSWDPTRNVVADVVTGQLGSLRETFGFARKLATSVREERIRTSFWTLVDELLDLRRAYENWKLLMSGASPGGFLGTDLVLIGRALEAASEQIDEYEDVLDSVLLGAAERQTIWLDRPRGLTLDGLLKWTKSFVRVDGKAYLNDSGRDGLTNAFAPTAAELVTVYQSLLVAPSGINWRNDLGDKLVVHAGYGESLLPALSAARSRNALASLFLLLEEIYVSSALASAYEKLVVLDVVVKPTSAANVQPRTFTVTVRVVNASDFATLTMALLNPAGKPVQPSTQPVRNGNAQGGTITAEFSDNSSTPELDEIFKHSDGLLLAPGMVPLIVLPEAGRNVGERYSSPAAQTWDMRRQVAAGASRPAKSRNPSTFAASF